MVASPEDRDPALAGPAAAHAGRTILLIGAAIGVVVVIAIGLALAVGSGTVRSYPADTPEGTVQHFLQAVDSHDYETAYGLLSADVRKRVSESDFVAQFSYGSPPENRRVLIDRVDRTESVATVHLSIDQFYGGQFGSDRYTSVVEIRLTYEDGAWRIDEDHVGLY